MKLKSVTTKFSVMIMAGVIALSGAGTVFAADSSSGQADKNFRPQRANFEEMTAIYQSALNKLVDEGTITQDQAVAVTAGMTTKAGINTDSGKKAQPTEHQSFLSKLVSDGTITQEQLDAVQTAMKAAMTSGNSKSNILDELVSAGTITQEQADAITSSMPSKAGMNGHDRGNAQSGERPVSKLVSDGTFTQEQADAITSRTTAKSGTWTHNEKTAAAGHMGFFSKLVSDGTITQEQADAICSAVKEAMDAARASE